ncbi:hypothetical protein ACKWTF_014157 [Chironomus riparius]
MLAVLTKPSKLEVINYSCNITVFEPNITGEKNCCKVVENLIILYKNVTIQTSDKIEESKIVSFYAANKEIHYFPKGIDADFPKLQNLVIRNSKLQKITSNDLKEFKFLKYLDFSHNEIEVLGPNLFDFGVTILQIVLNNNKIQFIHPTAFKPRNGMHHLDLTDNSCISAMANDQSKVLTFLNVVKASCPFYPLHIKELQTEVQEQKENLRKVEIKMDVLYIVVGAVLILNLILSINCIRKKISKNSDVGKVSSIRIQDAVTAHSSLNGLKLDSIYASYQDIVYESRPNNNAQTDDFYAETVINADKNVVYERTSDSHSY